MCAEVSSCNVGIVKVVLVIENDVIIVELL